MANTREPILTPALVEEEKRAGLTQRQIARKYGVTDQYVSKVKRKTEHYSKTPREQVMEHFPWTVPTRMQRSAPHHRIRDHAEYMATSGRGMSRNKLYQLYLWYRRLREENLVLEFSPDIPPSEATKYGGFAYRPREESDGDLIIRVNEHTTLTEEGKETWVFPEEMPNFRKVEG